MLIKSGSLDLGQPINWASPLNRGLVSRWQVINQGAYSGGARLLDLAGKNHGTLTNGPVWQGAMGRPGGFGSLKFDGSDDRVDTSLSFNEQFYTVANWEYVPSGTSGFRVQFENLYQFSHYRDGTGFNLALGNGSLWLTFPSCGTVSTNVWTHFASTYDGATIKGYINGLEVSSTPYSRSYYASAQVTKIGAAGSNSALSDGFLDDLRLYSVAKSASEISAIYQDSRRGYPETLNWQRRTVVFDMGAAPPASSLNYLTLLGVG